MSFFTCADCVNTSECDGTMECPPEQLREGIIGCGNCCRVYPASFPTCPYCYVEPFLKDEASDGACPTCGEIHRTICPECDRPFADHDHYCLYCGFIRNQPASRSY